MSSFPKNLRKRAALSGVIIAAGAMACSSNDTETKSAAEHASTTSEAIVGMPLHAIDLVARADTTYALGADTNVYGWGYNSGGAEGTQSQYFPLGHRSSDTDIKIGNHALVHTYLGVSNAKQLAAGPDGACALLNDGTVTCWGRPLADTHTRQEFLAQALYRPTPIRQISLSGSTPDEPMTGVTAITYGDAHACALKADGTVWCWGDDSFGQLGDGPDGLGAPASTIAVPMRDSTNTDVMKNIHAVVAAGSTTCVLELLPTNIGQVDCVGDNGVGQLGQGPGGNTHQTITNITAVPLTGFSLGALYAGGTGTFCASTAAVADSQTTYCWGANAFGQVGAGNTNGTGSPVQVSTDASAHWFQGNRDGCEVASTGALSCWGMNDFGQLPGAAAGVVTAHTSISGIPSVLKAAVGNSHICATASNAIYCWGNNTDAQLGDDACGTLPITDINTGVSVAISTSNYAVTSTSSYASDLCGAYIVEVTNASARAGEPVIVKPGTVPTDSLGCGFTSLSATMYGDGVKIGQTVSSGGIWNASTGCTYGNPAVNGIMFTIPSQYSHVRITGSSMSLSGGGGKGTGPMSVPVPVTVSFLGPCSNGVKDGNETGVDCGGSCNACPSCFDGVQNGNETGVDCGGSCKACSAPPSCHDGIQNGNETDVDCGGTCKACPGDDGHTCSGNREWCDCTNGCTTVAICNRCIMK